MAYGEFLCCLIGGRLDSLGSVLCLVLSYLLVRNLHLRTYWPNSYELRRWMVHIIVVERNGFQLCILLRYKIFARSFSSSICPKFTQGNARKNSFCSCIMSPV